MNWHNKTTKWFRKNFGSQNSNYELYLDLESARQFLKTELEKGIIKSGKNINGKFRTGNEFRATRIIGPHIEPEIFGMSDMYLYGTIIIKSNKLTILKTRTKPHLTYSILFTLLTIIGVITIVAGIYTKSKIVFGGIFILFSAAIVIGLVNYSRRNLISNFEKIINPLRIDPKMLKYFNNTSD